MSGSSSGGADPQGRVNYCFSWHPGVRDGQPIDQAGIERLAAAEQELLDQPFMKAAVFPAKDFQLALRGTTGAPVPSPDALEVRHLGPLEPAEVAFLDASVSTINGLHGGRKASVSPSLPMALAEVWSPNEAPWPYLGTTDLALAQIRAAAAQALGARGQGVVVVIVDQGINEAVLRHRQNGPMSFAGGWRVWRNEPPGWIEPGQWPDGHGTRMAELVLSVAPEATILDLPLIPQEIRALRSFVDWATVIYASMPLTISWAESQPVPTFRGPWVFCNAWSIYDLRGDFPPDWPASYGQSPANLFSRSVAELPRSKRADVVFAAGNGGQFAPDSRCAPGQIGPGRSIYGVAALRPVLTLGAVRGDEIWLGYSAQGPSPPKFLSAKPDLVAPSQFSAPQDAARGYSGTSAACALAAGAFAAVRSIVPLPGTSPAVLLDRAIRTARPLPGPPTRTGAGMLDLDRLFNLEVAPGTTWNGVGEQEPF